MTIDPNSILDRIPGWEGATVERLQGGHTNTSYKVRKGDKVGVLKVDDAPREAPLNTRCYEAGVQNAASKAGLAAPVILADDGFYLTEYLQGNVWTRQCLDKDGMLELVGHTLKRLHALPLTGRSFDASVAARRYVADIDGLDAEIVTQCSEIVDSMRLPQNLCCSHNDLVAENIITTPDMMMLLDWEYACDNDPFFDLATIAEHHELSDEQVTLLLNVYFDGDGARWRKYLERQRKLYLALLCLWLASRPDSDPNELESAVARLPTSYS